MILCRSEVVLDEHGIDWRIGCCGGLKIVVKMWNLWVDFRIEIYLNDHAPITCRVAVEDVLEDLAVCVSHMISAQDVEHFSKARDGRASGWLPIRHIGAWDKQVEGSRHVHELGILSAYRLS